MTAYEKICEQAADNYGYITTREASELGVPKSDAGIVPAWLKVAALYLGMCHFYGLACTILSPFVFQI